MSCVLSAIAVIKIDDDDDDDLRPAPKSHSAPQPQYVKPSVAWFIQSSVERMATCSSPADRPAATSLSYSNL